ncbi:DNA-binding protein [Brevundimonas sp. P7753]|uniref:DNA-binding protein n=1 Tax=Brevundimonas sp. P7753 TaxID=2726982 RepID=UPI0015BD4492|nr:DNA-binding protein [Brevundimonas sp. P7753]NWE53569.1 DNA-binding protein [Brevundimonas sp. P7753]
MTYSNVLYGAKAIAAYVFGDEAKWSRIIDMNRRLDEPHRFPMFYIGATLCARRTAIDDWIASREAANCNAPTPHEKAA